MRFVHHLFAALMLLSVIAIPASAEFVNEEWDDGDLGGWQAITADQFIENFEPGGVGGGGFLHTYQESELHGVSGAVQRNAPYIGDYSARGYIVVRCYLQFFNGNFTDAYFRVRYLDSSHNGWYVPLTTNFTVGSWQSTAVQFDPQWSDGEAIAAGWVQESNSASFAETMANVFTAEVRFLGDGLLEVGLDNFQLDDDLVGIEAASWGQVKALFR